MSDPTTDAAQARRAELAANLVDVRTRIGAAARAVGRDAAEITLVAITKTWPASDVALLAGLGVTDVGENRDQEAGPKHELGAGLALRWHFVGQLQRNKARSVASYADVVQSVDRLELVSALDRGASGAGRTLDVLLQVDLDDRPAAATGAGVRGGAGPAELAGLAEAVDRCAALRLAGVMAVAPLRTPARPAFDRLAALAGALRADHPGATIISAGMSGDLEEAIAAGATHVRVGTAVLGGRPSLR